MTAADVAVERLTHASNRSPMRRGLKCQRRRLRLRHALLSFKPIPDEEGTEMR